MSFTDVLKKSVTEGFASTDIPTIQVVLTLGITFVIALYIYFIYLCSWRKYNTIA